MIGQTLRSLAKSPGFSLATILVLALGIGGTRARKLLHEVRPNDPATFAVVSLVIVATSVVASLVPAWRAARTDPSRILRGQV